MKIKQRIKLFIVLGIEAIAIAVMLLLIFFAGKQVYTVTFDLDGGVLISGDLVQKVTQGHSATAPTAAKDGHYFLKWSGSYSRVTHDVTVRAIWEYETTEGIEYNMDDSRNYCTITGVFKHLQGEVYIGGYYEGKKVLAIEDGAFEGCTGITGIHLLDGILTIGDNAFAGCTALETIELPATAISLGDNAFMGCESLTNIVLPEELKELGNNAFLGCTALTELTAFEDLKLVGESAFSGCTALATVTFAEGLESLGARAFAGCTALETIELPTTLQSIGVGAFDGEKTTVYVCTYAPEGEAILPETFQEGWNGSATVEWKYLEEPVPEEEATEGEEEAKDDKKKKEKNK